MSAAEMPTPEGSLTEGVTAEPDAVDEAIRQVFDALRVRRARVVAALSGHAVIVKRLSVPAMSEDALADAIPWEAEQYIPFDLKDVQIDYQVLGPGSTDPSQATLDLLLVAAKRDRIDDRAAMVTRAGRTPVVVDVEAFALANAYEMNYPERTDPLAALIHVGRRATIVCLLERGQPAFTRDIPFGGQLHTNALVRELAVDEFTAERIKHGQTPPEMAADHVSSVQRDVTSQLVVEIRKTVDFYRATAPVEALSRCVLSGGGWRADGLADLLAAEFDAPVEVFDPFRRVDRSRRGLVADDQGPEYAIAVGLAMRQEGR